MYWLGPLVFGLLLGLGPAVVLQWGGVVLQLAILVACTVLVPALLIRYRKETLADYGIGAADNRGTFVAGLGAGAVIAAVGVALSLAAGLRIASVNGLAVLGTGLLRWVCIGFLGGYVVVKAREAFPSMPVDAREGVLRIGRIVALVGMGAAFLLVAGLAIGRQEVAITDLVIYVAVPGGVAAALWVALRRLKGTTTMATLLAPTIVLPLGQLMLSFNVATLLSGVFRVAVFAGIGLTIAALSEVHRSVWPAIGLGVCVAPLAFLGY